MADRTEQTVWFSKTGDYENFDCGTNDADAIIIAVPTTNEIRWLETLEALFVGTAGDEWKIGSNDLDTPITPTNYTCRQQSNYGSAALQPVKINAQILFIDFVGRKTRELTFNDLQQKYVSPDLTALAEHITNSGIICIAHQRNPDSILWAVLDNGTLISMSYEREQEVVAWAEHDIGGTSVSVQSVCVIPSTDEDEVWISVQRTIQETAVTHIEKMMPRDFGTDIDDAFFVDSGITATPSGTTVSGLDHLEGETVVVLGDGEVQSETTSGDFDVGTGAKGAGEITVPAGLTTCQVGLEYTYILEPMRPDVTGAGGTTHSSLVSVKEMGISFYRTMNAKYGVDTDNLYQIDWTSDQWKDNTDITGLFSGDVVVSVDSGFSLDNNLVVSGSDPLPCIVRAMIPKLDVSGR